uniref:tRNA (guanosine(18)-2'-O)-methyltransferase TARBP1 n=1 Tax=Cyclopterus lumpus TaxID=8103 RepID=A0A8C3G6X1_CYCLU
MFSVLIDAVLSSSPDYDILFESLTWPSDSWPGTERVEALTAFIEGLGPILSESDTTPLSAAKRRSIVDKINSVVWNQCLPLLSKVSTRAGEGMRCRETTAAACRLVSVCVPLCDEAVSGRVALSVLRSLQQSEEEMPGPGRLGVEVASEVMAALVPSLSADEQLTLTTLSYALSCIKTLPDSLVSKITVRLLLTVLKCCSGARLTSVLKLILEDMCRWHSTDRTPVVTERTLLCLTALSDHLLKPRSLPSSCDLDPRLCVQFWRMVQDGLTHRDCVSRKRALYLLKMCVSLSEQEGFDCPLSPSEEDILFKWAPSRSMLLREFWEDYALVMETLEENQIHVVRPVLNRIDTALSVAASGQVFFHPSWLLCVYQRMFHSENKSLMREGVCHLLELQALQQPAFASLTHNLSTCRSVGQSVGECPELGAKLQVFMTTFFTSLPSEHRGRMLLQMIQQLCSKHWCAAPLLFLSQALSKLPPGPLLGIEGLTALREVLRCTMVTHQVLLRGAAQCFLLNSALCLTKVSAVTFDDVFSFLVHFRADESLSRRTQIWNQLCAWLSDNEGSFKPRIMDGDCTKKETVRGYVQSEIFPCSSGLSERLPDSREADKLARAVLLCVDMERNHNKAKIGTTLESLLSPLLDTLSRVGTNLYLPLRKSDKSLQLVLQLFQLGGTPSCERTHSVANQVARAVAMASLATVCGLVDSEVIDMQSETISALKSLNDYFYNLVSSSCQSLGNLNKRLQKPQTGDGSRSVKVCLEYSVKQGLLLQDWGRIAANFMRDQWICLSFLMKAFGIPESVEISNDSETLKAALSCGVEALALLPSDLVLPVLTFIETVLPHLLLHDEPMCVEAVTLSWELVQGLSTNAHDFWPALKGFISMAFHRKLLELTDTSAPTLLAALKQVIQIRLVDLERNVLPMLQLRGELQFSMEQFVGLLWCANVFTLQLVCSSDNRDDQLPRTCVLAFLSHLESSNLQHERLMEELIMDLLKTDNDISKSKVRYYSNSLQHRVKNRVWQTLLLLLPKLRVEFVATVLNCVFEAGFCSNHASVKYQIEWMMILILVHYPHHIDSFWACFNRDHDKTKTSICTFLSVLVHFNVIIPHLQDKDVHLRKALDIILQWCFNHNFSVRLYALLALKRVWSLAGVQAEEGAGGLGGLSVVIEACLNQAEAMQSTGNANKNWTRIQEHFFFGAFHPVRDYSVEVCSYVSFEKVLCFSESPSFPLRNPAPDLSQLQPGDWIQQDKGEQNKEERWAEVQKKITPWRLGIQEQEPELQLIPQQRAARLGKLHGALLVVASLIDKPTNLGGLCRTCEIFGASALVLDSLRHVSDKHFQSLSVSSELWLPLLEVKPMELTDFLQVKKSEGYCIVGVEQTANSQSLQDYQFPEKTLLLLGNEREGIPANLLQMFDVCVEIPQQGVTRSLNVHVSAALLIWEYTRQHLTSGSAEVNSKT